jgi:hypothetical protein
VAHSAGKLSSFINDTQSHRSFLEGCRGNVSLLLARIAGAGWANPRRCDLELLHQRLGERLQMSHMPRSMRLLPAVWFYARGGYRSFSGWRSLAVDVMKRRCPP